MPPTKTLWTLDAHTIGKHLVLQNYMNAWLPIMSSWSKRVLFIDAFAGPGQYSKGEPGSPVIALRSFINHSARRRMVQEFNYVFIEKHRDRYEYLKSVLADMDNEIPSNCRYFVENSTFNETISNALDRLNEQRRLLAPALVMIDPFGVSDTPMPTVERILSNPHAEVYISFMYSFINRFKNHPAYEKPLDEMFGTTDWRACRTIQDPIARKHAFYDLYRDKLKAAGANYVVNFELYEEDNLVYAIFFGTHELKGCDKMKEAIWKVAPFDGCSFRGNHVGQLNMGTTIVDFEPLRQSLRQQFNGIDWISIEEIERFVMSDETEFHSGQLRDNALKPMEDEGSIEVKPGSRRQIRSYPPGTKLRFSEPKRDTAVPLKLF